MKEGYRRCCGIDIHKKTVVVCVLAPDGSDAKPIRMTYGTFRNELARMRGWLKMLKVTNIAMESTGVYWRPVWNLLEGHGFNLLLANPAQVKALAGRKSDARDCRRIAEFLQDHRLDGSFVPPPEIRRLRMLMRDRVSVLHQRNEIHNQIRDLLETANIKFSSVASDLMGVSGRRIIEAMIAGEDSPGLLSLRIRGKLQRKAKQVRESLKGTFDDFHRNMLGSLYRRYQFETEEMKRCESLIEQHMEPYAKQVELLMTIPGVDRLVAWNIIAELGADMTIFPNAEHCASWAGLAPGDNESAGKKISTRCRKGNRYLRTVMTQAAWAASHCKKGYLRAFFHRIKSRSDWATAIVALAHKILVIAYSMLRTGSPYQERGENYFDVLNPERTTRRLVKRLQELGLDVQLSLRPRLELSPGESGP